MRLLEERGIWSSMNYVNLIKAQREFITDIVERRMIIPAVVLGFLGMYSFPLNSYLARVAGKKEMNNEAYHMLVEYPLTSVLFFMVSVCIIYLVARLFKGRNDFAGYLIAYGFGGIYSLFISIALAPIPFLSIMITDNGQQPSPVYLFILFFLIIIVLGAAFYAIKYAILSISEVFKFGIVGSSLIWVCTFIPLFAVMNRVWQIQ
jgi:hypothetical protein